MTSFDIGLHSDKSLESTLDLGIKLMIACFQSLGILQFFKHMLNIDFKMLITLLILKSIHVIRSYPGALLLGAVRRTCLISSSVIAQ